MIPTVFIGTITAEFSYKTWGRMRNPDHRTDYILSSSSMTYFRLAGRGFTGHEHLIEFEIINMGARLYDVVLGQFLSPDNYVQMPEYSQNYNRYMYAFNSPVQWKVPSGNDVQVFIKNQNVRIHNATFIHSSQKVYLWDNIEQVGFTIPYDDWRNK
jgi:RHS repeat-associated protein